MYRTKIRTVKILHLVGLKRSKGAVLRKRANVHNASVKFPGPELLCSARVSLLGRMLGFEMTCLD